ncbi:MAG TPA: alanine racemase [Methyloceanibacter sp.]|nr:alanine racemase [Methyloceanibacter sp.]
MRTERAPSDARDEGPDETAILTIDRDAVAANYRTLRALAAPAECAAVVKADAYGLGMIEIAPTLWDEGCKTFFVATLDEGGRLRALLPGAVIYVLAGLMPGTEALYARQNLRSVLNSADEVREWAAFCKAEGEKLPCAVHIDTGMNRLGLAADEVEGIASADALWSALALSLVMSHLACADEPDHPKNETQRKLFDRLRARLPRAPASFANSPGVLLGPAYCYDVVRPGLALYGGRPRAHGDNPFRPVVQLMGRVLRVRDAAPGETVGYGATRSFRKPARLAIVSVGYADGFFRSLSVADGEAGAAGYFGPHAAPIVGRVSMDLAVLDVSGVPEQLARRGAFVELIGPNVLPHELARHAGTIDYEVLTNLGSRAFRRYVGG